MLPWGIAGGFLWAYNLRAVRQNKGTACSNARALAAEDKALAFLVWLWFGAHLFMDRG